MTVNSIVVLLGLHLINLKRNFHMRCFPAGPSSTYFEIQLCKSFTRLCVTLKKCALGCPYIRFLQTARVTGQCVLGIVTRLILNLHFRLQESSQTLGSRGLSVLMTGRIWSKVSRWMVRRTPDGRVTVGLRFTARGHISHRHRSKLGV